MNEIHSQAEHQEGSIMTVSDRDFVREKNLAVEEYKKTRERFETANGRVDGFALHKLRQAEANLISLSDVAPELSDTREKFLIIAQKHGGEIKHIIDDEEAVSLVAKDSALQKSITEEPVSPNSEAAPKRDYLKEADEIISRFQERNKEKLQAKEPDAVASAPAVASTETAPSKPETSATIEAKPRTSSILRPTSQPKTSGTIKPTQDVPHVPTPVAQPVEVPKGIENTEDVSTKSIETSVGISETNLPKTDMYGRVEPTLNTSSSLETVSIESKRRLTIEEYSVQIEIWKKSIDGAQEAVENVEKIIQDKRNTILWRLTNLGVKNVTAVMMAKLRTAFSTMKKGVKNFFGFGEKKDSANESKEIVLSKEYITKPGENLASIIMDHVLSIPEMNGLTADQKEKVIQHLFEYSKMNPYMSMFDQVNKYSSEEAIQPGEVIDLQMIRRLISFPVDHFDNKTIIEYATRAPEHEN